MKRWRAQIRVADDQIGVVVVLNGTEIEHVLDKTNLDTKYWDAIIDKEPSGFGGYWYKVEVTSNEIGVDDDGNPL